MTNRKKSLLGGGAALLVWAVLGAAAPAMAKDVYKAYLDPAQPHHRAILDTLDRLKDAPNNAALHNDLGCLIAWDGFWRDAIREFDTAAKLDKKDSKPLFNEGLVHAWSKNWSAARSDFAAATRREAGNWTAWWMLGFAREQLGDVHAALEAYQTSLRVDTSLFDVAKNPFAAETKLRALALAASYERRRMRAALPIREQFADPERIAGFFQRTPAPGKGGAAPEEAPSVATGPIVTTAPPPSSGGGAAGRPRREYPPVAIVPTPPEQASPADAPPAFQNVTPAPPRRRVQPGPGGMPPPLQPAPQPSPPAPADKDKEE